MDQQQSTTLKRGSDGFLIRGSEATRLEAFVDAAFAFAVTLLVVGGGDSVPTNYQDFIAAMKQVPAFAACFANVLFFWYAHYRWSRRYGLEDLRSTLLSVVLVFVVLIYVYPLRAVYSGAIDWFSGGYFPSMFSIDSVDDLRAMFIIFGIGYASMSAVIALLDAHALTLADEMELSDRERFDTKSAVLSWVAGIAIAGGSILIAALAPDMFVVAAGMFYASFGVVMPILAIARARQWDKRSTP